MSKYSKCNKCYSKRLVESIVKEKATKKYVQYTCNSCGWVSEISRVKKG